MNNKTVFSNGLFIYCFEYLFIIFENCFFVLKNNKNKKNIFGF